ncbi:MAG: hypothetical protein IJD40_11280 [Lachnospiraceae bacterium]|nr:hypothetical protein [Lachnospiraceae bacterium]
MKTFKQICKKNWYIIASTLFLFVSSEVLVGVMVYDQQYFILKPYDSYVSIAVLRVLLLFAGFLISYFCAGILKKKYSPLILSALMLLAVIYRENDLNLLFNYYSICFVAVMLSLAFYYVNYCTDSIKHTLLYIAATITLWGMLFYEIEFFVIVAVNVFLFITNQKSISQKSVKAVNLIFTGISLVFLILKSVMHMISHMEYRHNRNGHLEIGYTESETIPLLEKMMITSEDFGTSEFFGEFADERYVYNLAKIFGYYGYYAGVAMVIMVVAFAASVLVGCCKKQDKVKSVCGAAAIMLVVRTIAALFINFGIISTIDSHLPFISICACGCLNAGLIIGFLFAADKEMITKGAEINENTCSIF